MTKYDERHGGAYDRGRADAWYRRAPEPHYYVAGTRTSDLVTEDQMTAAEVQAYHAGYDQGWESGDHKNWD